MIHTTVPGDQANLRLVIHVVNSLLTTYKWGRSGNGRLRWRSWKGREILQLFPAALLQWLSRVFWGALMFCNL
jgi:hypothetical protein